MSSRLLPEAPVEYRSWRWWNHRAAWNSGAHRGVLAALEAQDAGRGQWPAKAPPPPRCYRRSNLDVSFTAGWFAGWRHAFETYPPPGSGE